MTVCARTCVLLCLLAGCQGTSQVFDNPVVGPPPPRVEASGVAVAAQDPAKHADEPPGAAESDSESGAAQVKLTNFAPADARTKRPVTGLPGEVAARVNGTPILVAEILQPYAPKLEEFRAHPQITDEEFARMQRNLVERDLPFYIETAVVVDAVLSKMDAEQRAQVEEQLDAIFQDQLEQMLQAAGVQSVGELEAKLKAAGSSLASEMQVTGETVAEIRKSFGRRALSAQYLREAIGTIPVATRQELLDEYRRRRSEFSQPARVKWQQLQISFAAHNGKDNAIRALARARADLQAGTSFDEVVRQHGDGPLAKLGGHFDWTQPESIADPKLREALESLPAGEISGPIESEKALLLVKVTESQPARTAPFEEVQDELRKSITKRKKEERVAAVLAEIKAKAVVETMFDGEAAAADRQESPVSAAKATGS